MTACSQGVTEAQLCESCQNCTLLWQDLSIPWGWFCWRLFLCCERPEAHYLWGKKVTRIIILSLSILLIPHFIEDFWLLPQEGPRDFRYMFWWAADDFRCSLLPTITLGHHRSSFPLALTMLNLRGMISTRIGYTPKPTSPPTVTVFVL